MQKVSTCRAPRQVGPGSTYFEIESISGGGRVKRKSCAGSPFRRLPALPVGVNSYLFAERYRVGQAEAAAAILIATVLSVATVTVLLGLLGVGS